jgi:N utilization substance protein B
MSSNNRRVARECALKILFAIRLDEQADASRLLTDFWQNFRFADDSLGEPLETADQPLPTAVRSFAEILVRGVIEYRAVIDKQIREVAKNWTLERMASVDLSILRICSYELLYQPDVPVQVAINEAIEIAKRYGTKESPSFVNGLLDKVAANVRKNNK